MKKIVIIGASGHGKVAADIALKCGYTDIVFLDDNISIKNCGRHSVVGSNDRVEDINGDGGGGCYDRERHCGHGGDGHQSREYDRQRMHYQYLCFS